MSNIVKIKDKNNDGQGLTKYVHQNTYGNSIVPISERNITDKIPETIVDFLKRRDRLPIVGDIVYHDSPYGKNFLKITRIEEEENTNNGGEKYTFKKYYHQTYSFESKIWEESKGEYTTASTLKEYYVLVLEDFDELLEKAEIVHSGEETNLFHLLDLKESDMIDGSNQSSETSLTTTKLSKEELVSMMDRCALIKNKAGEVMACVKGFILAETNRMEAIKKKLDSQIAIFSQQIREIMKVIQMIELYCGINEELLQITSGVATSPEEPLVIRQMILFMDEEVAVSNVYANLEEGFDYKDIGKFNKWLVNPQNRDQVIPNKKCIVIMKPRRYTKDYYDSYNPQQVANMNKWNRESYLLIRNGDNLYSIFSDNLFVYDKVFPDKAKVKELFEKIANMTERERNESGYDKSTSDLNSIMDRSKSFAMMVQGLIDRSDVFKPHNPELSIFKNESGLINFVYDDENILTDGKQLFKDWKKEINKTITRGSRIVMMSPSYYGYGRCNGEAMKERFFKWYTDYPPIPSDGIYTLEEKLVEYFDRESQSKKKSPVTFIRYDAGGSYYKFGQGYVDRVKKVSFMIHSDDNFILNYDKVSLEDIDYYINSRVDRKEYAWMMPVMKFLRKKTLEEIEKEKNFITMVSHEIFRELGGFITFEKSKELVNEAIQWWKYKVIWKRPVNKDDAKAYRMIKEKILRDIKKKTNESYIM